ncbi:MAG: triose-phosphate isomerase [Gemmataceae bacterium]
MPRPKFIAGNWKMYTTRTAAADLAAAVVKGVPTGSATRVAVCPPFPWLTAVADVVKGTAVGLGGQNCHYETEGAFTGEVSPQMLVDAGCGYVIVGHSERRHGLGETDAVLNKKAKAALAAGLSVIFCVGETLAEREAERTESVLETQLTAGLAGLTAAQMGTVVIAYEPVWAIGTGKVATPDQAQAAHAFIRRRIAGLFDENTANGVLIQYGGSVKADNAAGLLHLPDVDGALVGGASLKADQFLAIVQAAG